MRVIATLDPSVRLIVIQFLVPLELIPDVIPPKRVSDDENGHSVPKIKGVEILSSTPKIYLLDLLDNICPITGQGSYELVDSWCTPRSPGDKWFVRYVFCYKEHVERDKLFPDFIAKRDELIESLAGLAGDNLWAVQAYLNPYFGKDGRPTGHKVLMLGCAGRQQAVGSDGCEIKVYRDSRDQFGQGIGPKVPMPDTALHLKVESGNIVLSAPSERAFVPPALA